VSEIGVGYGKKYRSERGDQEMKSTPLYSMRCEGCGGVK